MLSPHPTTTKRGDNNYKLVSIGVEKKPRKSEGEEIEGETCHDFKQRVFLSKVVSSNPPPFLLQAMIPPYLIRLF
jgi:hypothetical protein